jgi:hypothetical protein
VVSIRTQIGIIRYFVADATVSKFDRLFLFFMTQNCQFGPSQPILRTNDDCRYDIERNRPKVLPLPNHYAMMAYRGVEVKFHAFLTSVLVEADSHSSAVE